MTTSQLPNAWHLPQLTANRVSDSLGELLDLGCVIALDHDPCQRLGARVSQQHPPAPFETEVDRIELVGDPHQLIEGLLAGHRDVEQDLRQPLEIGQGRHRPPAPDRCRQ